MSLAKKRREALLAQTGGGDRIKLGLMIGLLIIVLAGFAVLSFTSGGGGEAPDGLPPEPPPGIENDEVSAVREDADGRLRAKATTETDFRDDLGEEAKIDPSRLTGIQDASPVDRETIEGDPLDYLLDQVTNVGPILRKRRGFHRIPAGSLVGAPDQYRGAAVEFKGRILEGTDLTYEDRVSGVTTIHRGFLQVLPEIGEPEGDPVIVSFTCVGRPGTPATFGEDPEPFEPGHVVRIYGYYLKAWRATRPGTSIPVDTPHVVVQRFARSYVVTPQTEVDPTWFKVGQGDRLDEPMFFLGLNYLRNLTPEAYRERRRSGAIGIVPIPEAGDPFPESVPDGVVTDFDVRGKILHDKVKLYQGKLVRVSGTLVRPDPVFPEDNQGGIESFWQAFLFQGNYVVPIACPFPPDRYGVSEKEDVYVEGYFYKRLIWEPANGDQDFRAPLLLVTDMYPKKIGDNPLIHIQWVLAVVAAGFVVVLVWMLFRDRRSSREHEERRRKLRDNVRQKGAGPDWTPREDAGEE